MSYISLEQIRKKYNVNTTAEVYALRGIELKINKGEFVSIVGPSGSGKSTLLHILGCIDTATEGRYTMQDKDLSQINNKELASIWNKKLGFVLQEFGLILNNTSIDNVSIPLMFSKTKLRDIKNIAYDTLKKVGIEELAYKKVSQLSGGQRQRVAIARALVNNPEIILADEPTGSLDENTSMEIMKLLMELNKEERTVIIVTHNMDIAKMCNRIITIKDGKVVED
jgi:putative ABC transport system ATP-binding protein